jgi:hypothetical protein
MSHVMSTVTTSDFRQLGRSPGRVPAGLAGVGGDLEHLRRDVLGDVGLAAVLTDLGWDFVDDDRLTLAVERHRRRSRSGLSVVADDALHRFFLRVLKSGSHSAGSGR